MNGNDNLNFQKDSELYIDGSFARGNANEKISCNERTWNLLHSYYTNFKKYCYNRIGIKLLSDRKYSVAIA